LNKRDEFLTLIYINMKKIILLSIIWLVCVQAIFSQTNGPISIVKKKVYQNDTLLTRAELYSILKSEPASKETAEKAESSATTGTVLAGIGSGAALIYGVLIFSSSVKDANNVSNGNLNTTDPSKYSSLFYIAVGTVALSIPFLITSNKQLKKSVSLYNSKNATGFRQEQNINFRLSPAGFRLTYNF
jgi:hypothetical protein